VHILQLNDRKAWTVLFIFIASALVKNQKPEIGKQKSEIRDCPLSGRITEFDHTGTKFKYTPSLIKIAYSIINNFQRKFNAYIEQPEKIDASILA